MDNRSPVLGNEVITGAAALHDMEARIDELPLLPQILVKVLQLNPETDNYFEQFEKLAKEDPAFSVRIVALANSAAFASVDPITTIRDSLTRIGTSAISSLVASLAVQRVFMPVEPGQIGLWKHSITVAVTAQQIALLAPGLEVAPEQAYLTGLLHDIGRFVMLEHATPQLLKVDESNWHSPEELIEADIEVYKYTHSELGYRACVHWGLPVEIADVVRMHHAPLDEIFVPGSVSAIRFCVQIADRVCLSILENPGLEEMTIEEFRELITLECLRTEKERQLLSVTDLCHNLLGISIDSKKLLLGLGFAT